MINKRLIGTVSQSKKYIAGNVICQWVSLASNITMMTAITLFIERLLRKSTNTKAFVLLAVIVAVCVAVRAVCAVLASRMSYLSSKEVKLSLRQMIYKKLLRLGASYTEKVKTSEIVQVAVEGIEQLETYFGAYLPQFFYAMLAPLTLFIVLSFVDIFSAIVLLICVPLIPVTIIMVQKWAKKLLAKYWGQYTELGDTFLENLQGLTTLKIYQADRFKHDEMNEESEKFRKITMKVLTMQLNSITVMDLIAYGGAALGVVISVSRYNAGKVSFTGCLLIILLSADFFIPMRQLGSFFHIAMNGMAASDKIFRLLDLPEDTRDSKQNRQVPKDCHIVCSDVSFSYEEDREILHGVTLDFPMGSFSALVGESGCGKSTIAGLLTGRNRHFTGDISIGGESLQNISEESLMDNVTYISHQSYLFKGTVRDNLLMGKHDASDSELWSVLETTKLGEFVRSQNGLDTLLEERAQNFSGGQRQRLALARAILHDSPIYIFDEATSNIDVESENDIMEQIYEMAKSKTVILISHRLANVVNADRIYVMDGGAVAESGTHNGLLENDGVYRKLWNAQRSLEKYGKDGGKHE